MANMYTITQYISNICCGINKEVESVQRKLTCSQFPILSLDIPATGPGVWDISFAMHW